MLLDLRRTSATYLRPVRAFGLATVLAAAAAGSPLAQAPASPATRGLTVVPAPVGPSGETVPLYTSSRALLVGVSRYDNPAWSGLPSIPRELDDVAAALTSLGFDHVERVIDPTGQQLRQAVADFMKRYDADGARLLFVFSGHGWTLDGQRGYFVTRDSPDPNADRAGFRDTALSMQQVVLWAEELFARHVLFAFDSCFSGTIFRTRDRAAPSRLGPATAKPVRQFLSAGDAGETVPASSIFIPLLIRGIRGAADLDGDGYVTGTELGNYVQYEAFQIPDAKQKPQFGKIRDPRFDEGDLVFAVPGGRAPAAPRTRTDAAPAPAPPAGPPPASRSSGLDTDVARRALAERGIGWSAASLASALTSADADVLDLFLKGGVEHGMLVEALGSKASDGRPVAEAFFERGRHNTAVTSWLGAVLDRGLDPNATIKGSYYKKEGLLNSAVRAGNAEAVELLVSKGASPHAYQDLWFTDSSVVRFLFPFKPVIEHASMSTEEKAKIVKSYLAAGAIIPRLELRGVATGESEHTMALGELSKAQDLIGVKLTPAAPAADQASHACAPASKRDRFDWCALYTSLPTHIWADFGAKGMYVDFFRLEIVGLLTIVDGKAYLMGMERESYGPGLDVVEVSRDARTWQVFRYMSPAAGMGLCQPDPDGSRSERCWRRISMTYLPDKQQMSVENYYPYRTGSEFPAK